MSLSPHWNKSYAHLPTPQSPHNLGQYVRGVSHSAEPPATPSPHQHYVSTPVGQRSSPSKLTRAETRNPIQPLSQQMFTPESSPFPRSANRQIAKQPSQTPSRSGSFAANDTSTSYKTEPPSSLAPAPHIFSSAPSREPSCLSPPSVTKPSPFEEESKSRASIRSLPPLEHNPMPVDIVFPLQPNASNPPDNTGILPSSPSLTPPPKTPKPVGGGEIHRIREAMMQERLAYFQEAESRRPDYMKRAKRTLDEADPSALDEDERTRQLDREALVGITESPTKGRRLKLFQETSEESFEESLMAGGYGRYRTAEWVRQPQPMLLATAGPAGPSNVVSILEKAQEAPPTEKELKKRKRLAAFRGSECHKGLITKLHPVELEGRGRVLLDISGEEDTQAAQDTPPVKKKGGGRRKKKGGELTAKEKKSLATATEPAGPDLLEKPNWPDTEFPWRLRQLERTEEAKAVEAEKLRWIERFLDGDSDSEDGDEPLSTRLSEEEVYEEWDVCQPIRRGRGKMVPLSASPNGRPQAQRKSAFFPTDPADARAALLSKKSVRTLSYRQQRRKRREEEDSDDEILCLCNGVDDGRELVQCDGCETWYHLECIGIKDIAELGNEEDPWYCRECDEYGCRSPASEPPELSSEPTFVPTADAPQLPSYDPPFYQPPVIQDSPMPWSSSKMPQTPTRRRRGAEADHGSSGSSWVDSSRNQPLTPQHPAPHVKVYTGPYDRYEEPPFDPTSTPSRGMKIGAPFTTPKNNAWSTRANGMFQTPLRTTGGRNSWGRTTSAGIGALFETGGGVVGYGGGIPPTDESPIRRKKSGEAAQARRFVNSPLASRSSISMPHSLFDESPVMRFEGPSGRR